MFPPRTKVNTVLPFRQRRSRLNPSLGCSFSYAPLRATGPSALCVDKTMLCAACRAGMTLRHATSRDACQVKVRQGAGDRLAAISQFDIYDRLVPNIGLTKANGTNHPGHNRTIALQRAIHGALGQPAWVLRSRSRHLQSAHRPEHDESPSQASGKLRTGAPL